jgi:DNA invertase Pin-like site-specific DNA recombinase
VIDDDLGRSGSGFVERPGFQKLVASVCSGSAGAVFCIEASRLACNGRDWHHLIDLCALVRTLVIDPDGTYDDRLLLGLKRTMSEYELSLLRQRGIASRDSKALRENCGSGYRPGYCWNEIGQIEIDPDERVRGVIRLLFDKFQELGSVRQVLLWTQDQVLQLPISRRNNTTACKIEWRPAAYHTVLQILRHPVYAGAYVFGCTTQRTRIVDGRARKTTGHTKPMTSWNVLISDAESARGVSPRAAHRSGRDTLASSGSCHRTKTAAFRREGSSCCQLARSQRR